MEDSIIESDGINAPGADKRKQNKHEVIII
jgi:hypothetical protein